MNIEPSSQPQRPRAFVMRIIQDAQGNLHGQISEPSAAGEWRATFASAADLWRFLTERLACPPEPSLPNDSSPEDSSDERSQDESLNRSTD